MLIDKKGRWTATVRADGSVLAGDETGSIHERRRQAAGRAGLQRLDLLALSSTRARLKPIDALRQLYLLAIEP